MPDDEAARVPSPRRNPCVACTLSPNAGMSSAHRLDEIAAIGNDGAVNVVVECPQGSAVKLKYEPELSAMTLVRPLPYGVVFPYDFGFVPGTLAEDGDPLDAMVLLDAPTYPGIVIACRPVGVVRASQRGSEGRRIRNDRIVCVAEVDRRKEEIERAGDVPVRLREELEAFFAVAVAFEDKELALLGWGGRDEARSAVSRAIEAARAGGVDGGSGKIRKIQGR